MMTFLQLPRGKKGLLQEATSLTSSAAGRQHTLFPLERPSSTGRKFTNGVQLALSPPAE